MIPRLKPFIGSEELLSLIHPYGNAVEKFERAFASRFSTRHAIAFPYGRSALWAFLKALGIEGAEVVQPAYTCSVVGHATVLSNNIPIFVDINLNNYNMDLDLFRKAITPRTRAVIPTHIFGNPMDIDSVNQIVHEAESRFGQRIYIVQDCAHSFEAEWQGRSVINAGDGALFGMNISKQITSIFGGMFTTNDDEVASKVLIFREENFSEKSLLEKFTRMIYLPMSVVAFNDLVYSITYWLQNNTRLLKGVTDAYHLDPKINFPPDYLKRMAAVEARVGLEQIKKYAQIKTRRREIALYYLNQLKVSKTWVMPPMIEGATYSHFAIRVPDRDRIMQQAAKRGVQLGQLIEYSMPHLPMYRKYALQNQYPNSLLCSHSMVNLPVHPGLSNSDIEDIVGVINRIGQG